MICCQSLYSRCFQVLMVSIYSSKGWFPCHMWRLLRFFVSASCHSIWTPCSSRCQIWCLSVPFLLYCGWLGCYIWCLHLCHFYCSWLQYQIFVFVFRGPIEFTAGLWNVTSGVVFCNYVCTADNWSATFGVSGMFSSVCWGVHIQGVLYLTFWLYS